MVGRPLRSAPGEPSGGLEYTGDLGDGPIQVVVDDHVRRRAPRPSASSSAALTRRRATCVGGVPPALAAGARWTSGDGGTSRTTTASGCRSSTWRAPWTSISRTTSRPRRRDRGRACRRGCRGTRPTRGTRPRRPAPRTRRGRRRCRRRRARPGAGGRVVQERLSHSVRVARRRGVATTVPLPTPPGPTSTKMSGAAAPGRACRSSERGLRAGRRAAWRPRPCSRRVSLIPTSPSAGGP